MKFSLEPMSGEDCSFDQWRDAVAALARRPVGIPANFRHKIWLALATDYINSLQLDWTKVVQFAFNDKCNPDDDALGLQIVKDLHRTGCSSFSGQENEADRVVLQRVLLAYARWNKVTGYCQGFNIIAALILDVTNKNEADALKVMIYLVDKVLPKEYFAHNLRALTVDMAVFRSYLAMKLPRLSAHLLRLQEEARDETTGANVEPPLTNVFTMQWFLTIFATCLPVESVYKVWDCVMLDGSEILIRTALVIWTKLAKKLVKVNSADEFYMTMGSLSQQLSAGTSIGSDELVHNIYKMAPLPLPKLTQLREKYLYDITPFSAVMNSASRSAAYGEEEAGEDIQELAKKSVPQSDSTLTKSLNVSLLKKQYSKLIYRQKQARVLMRALPTSDSKTPLTPKSVTPIAMNHLFVGKELSEHKRLEAVSRMSAKMKVKDERQEPIEAVTPRLSHDLSTRLGLFSGTQAAGRHGARAKKTTPKDSGDAARANEGEVTPTDVKSPQSGDTSPQEVAEERVTSQITSNDTKAKDHTSKHDTQQPAANSHQADNDDVFLPEKSPRSRTPPKVVSPPSKPTHAVGKVYSPFPKPVTGLLSADKAKVGVRLGLYTTRGALNYMSPSQRSQFIARERENFPRSRGSGGGGTLVSGSRSSFW